MQQEIWFQKYKILGLLGRGGTAKVYLAEHILLNSYRAIKFISKNHPLYDLQRKEAFILKNLKHSCIPIIYDIEENEEGSYIVEQYLEGITLSDYVVAKGTIREDIIIHFGIQICDLINYLHSTQKPVLYLDLKPENIMVAGDILKLFDFGSAVYRDDVTDNQCYSGTKGYAAPEAYGLNKIDERCDIYSIGMLLYSMCTGLRLRDNLSSMDNIDQAGSCSRQLKNIINRCVRFHPAARYASVDKLIKELSKLKQKNQFNPETEKMIQIAIAGAQRRIGVTHFAFRLCNYSNSKRCRCLYQERNDSGCMRSILLRYDEPINKDGIYYVEGIPMLADKQDGLQNNSEFQMVVQDFGCLTKDNLPAFLEAKVKLLILGAKDWELSYAEQVLDMVAEYKDVIYLFNFMNGIQYQSIMKAMDHRLSYRIPYEPDPFIKLSENKGESFFAELFEMIRKGRTHEAQTHANL